MKKKAVVKAKGAKRAARPTKAQQSMKPQLDAQMKKKPKVKLSGEPTTVRAERLGRHVWRFGRKKKNGTELWACVLCGKEHEQKSDELPDRPLEGCRAAGSEAATVDTLPCADCGEELHHGNRSILTDGTVRHIGCKRVRKQPTVYERDEKKRPEPKLAGLPTVKGAKVPKPPPPPPPSKYGDIAARSDHQGRTCLQLKRDVSTVTYVKMDTKGLHLTYASVAEFDGRYRPIKTADGEYDVVKAVQHYVTYAKDYGATQDVLDFLGRVVKLKEEEIDMAKKKLVARGTTAGAAGARHSKSGRVRAAGTPRESAASLYKELIMGGKLTDDQIHAAVAKKFGDKPRSYVSWYRNHLKKAGLKPPAPKGEKKAA